MSERIKPIIERCTSLDLKECLKSVEEISSLSSLNADEKRELSEGLATLYYRDREHTDRDLLIKAIVQAERAMVSFGTDIIPWLLEQLKDADAESAEHLGRVLGQLGAPAVEPLKKALEASPSDSYACINFLVSAGHFSDPGILTLLPLVLKFAGSKDDAVHAQALHCLGRIANRIKGTQVGENDRTAMFQICFDSLSHPTTAVRRHAVRSLGKFQLNYYLNEEQLDKAHKAFRAVLGLDDYDWDRAYIVRHEAELSLRYFRQENRTDMGHTTGISSKEKYTQDFKILEKKELATGTTYFKVHAPLIARKIEAGQFVIIRPNGHSERIPLSIAGWNRDEGYLEIIIMAAGRTSTEATRKNVGESFHDVVGPLGQRSHVQKYEGTCVVIGGGYGTGAVIPTARDLKQLGNKVAGIVGARSKDLLIMTEELQNACDSVYITTNDGSAGIEGFVTTALEKIMEKEKVSMVLAVGPVPMMKAVADMTRDKGIECYVSLNAIMVDGTGMCGACRVSVDQKTRFACFHGPDFDGHKVDFEELTKRLKMFMDKEKIAMEAIPG